MPPKAKLISPDDLVARTFAAPAAPGAPPTPPGGPGKAAPPLPYRLYVPRDYVQTRRYPLLVVLHGAGEKGNDNEKHLGNGVLAFCDAALQKRHPTFVLYPQCPDGARWVEAPWAEGQYDQAKVPLSQPMAALQGLLGVLGQEFTVDTEHLLLAGLSMGGYGTWDFVTRFPERCAGALAICGGGDPGQAARAKNVPIWAFHGAVDEVVPVRGSRLMVEALRKAGGQVKYSEFAGADHHIWERVFADRAKLTWLLSRWRPPAPSGAKSKSSAKSAATPTSTTP